MTRSISLEGEIWASSGTKLNPDARVSALSGAQSGLNSGCLVYPSGDFRAEFSSGVTTFPDQSTITYNI